MILEWLLSKRFLKHIAQNVSDDVRLAETASPGIKSGWQKFSDSLTSGISNWWKGFTGSGLTQRDIELNQQNMQNVEDTAAAQVRGYEKAGVNPALMYGNGASNSAPQTSDTGAPGNMSELMQLLLLPAQMKMLSAQTKQVDASTQKTIAETGQIKQIMDWYPSLTEATIAEIVSKKGLNVANISKTEVETAIAEFDKIIRKAEADEAPAFFKARREYEEAKDDESKANAAAALARAAWDKYETNYTREHNGARPSSSSILALANAISSWLGTSGKEIGTAINKIVPTNTPFPAQEAGRKAAGEPWKIKGKTVSQYAKSLYNRAKRAFSSH